MNKKYELVLDDTIELFGRKLFRIRAKISFGVVKEGELGGYIESEKNLSHSGNAWVSGDAEVYGNARVSGDARVCGNAWVSGDAEVKSSKDYIVFKNTWSSFRWFTYTKSNKMWKVGCFCGTGQELIKKAYSDSEDSGKHYEAYVFLVAELEKIEESVE